VVSYPLIHRVLEDLQVDTRYVMPDQVPAVAAKLATDLAVLGSFNVVGNVIATSMKVVDARTGKVLAEDTRFGYEDRVPEFLEDLEQGLWNILFGEGKPTPVPSEPSGAAVSVGGPSETLTSEPPPPNTAIEAPSASRLPEAPEREPRTVVEPLGGGRVGQEIPPHRPVETSPPPGQTGIEVEGPVVETYRPSTGLPSQERVGEEPMIPAETAPGRDASALPVAPGAPYGTTTVPGIGPPLISPVVIPNVGSPMQPFAPMANVAPGLQSPAPPVGAGQPFAPMSPGLGTAPPAASLPSGPKTTVNPIEAEIPPLQGSQRIPPNTVQSPFQPMQAQPTQPPSQPMTYPYVPPPNQQLMPPPEEKKGPIRRVFSWFGRVFRLNRDEVQQPAIQQNMYPMPPPEMETIPQQTLPQPQQTQKRRFPWIFNRQESNSAPSSSSPSKRSQRIESGYDANVQVDGFVDAGSEKRILVASLDPNLSSPRSDVPTAAYSPGVSVFPSGAGAQPENAGLSTDPFPGPESLSELGSVYFERGNYDLAEDTYRKALAADPKRADLFFNLAQTLLARGKDAEAVGALQKTVDLDPKDAEALDRLGALHAQRGEWEEAVDTYTQLAVLDPTKARPFVKLGLAFDMAGNPRQAIRAYKKALSFDPDNAQAARNIASVYLKLGRKEEAKPYIQMAKGIDKNTSDVDRFEWLSNLPGPSKSPTRGTLFTQ